MAKLVPPSPADIAVKGQEDDNEITAMVNNITAEGGAKSFARDLMQTKRARR